MDQQFQPLNTDAPAFRALVVQITDERLDEVLARIRARLENDGYTDAARYVTRDFGE